MPDPYLDSATGVLRNRLGITDADTLARAEAWFAFHAEVEMYASGATIDRCDLAALQAVHRRLFGDVYDWAGELRTVDIAKGASTFALARHLRHAAADVFRRVERIDLLRGLDARRFAAAAGHLLADLNALHPFREGNGRAQRALLQLLARDAGYQLRLGDVEPTENIDVSAAAMSDPDAFTPLLPAGRDADRDGAPGDRARTSCDGPQTVRPGRWQVHLLVHLHGCVSRHRGWSRSSVRDSGIVRRDASRVSGRAAGTGVRR